MGIEHFLVMFPSAMLIAKLCNSPYGAVAELPTILLACGAATFFFVRVAKIPFFLGPSFSYIGFVSYQVSKINNAQTLEEIRANIFWGYIIAGILLLILCLAYRLSLVKKVIAILFPSTVMGPAISLIGLELASIATEDAGFAGGNHAEIILALATLIVIIISSLVRLRVLKNASVVVGILSGCFLAFLMKMWQKPIMPSGFFLHFPKIYLDQFIHIPSGILMLTLSVIPSTIIVFVESMGRIAVYDGMMRRDKENYNPVETSNKSLLFHALSNLGGSAFAITPTAIYAENLAIMNLYNTELSPKNNMVEDKDPFINKCYSPYSTYPYIIASILCILVACIRSLQNLFLAIPMPVLGGMELFIFGLIAAPGIQILVEQQTNYKKIANQIITASVLMAGVSGMTLSIGTLTLRGMSLGLVIGVIVNMLTILLSKMGLLNERFTLNEILDECLIKYQDNAKLTIRMQAMNFSIQKNKTTEQWKRELQERELITLLREATSVTLEETPNKLRIEIEKNTGNIVLKMNISQSFRDEFQIDHPSIIMKTTTDGITEFFIDDHFSKPLLKKIIRAAQ